MAASAEPAPADAVLAELVVELLAVVRASLTTHGHVAIKANQEYLGICNTRIPQGLGCSETCARAREVVARAEGELEARGVAPTVRCRRRGRRAGARS